MSDPSPLPDGYSVGHWSDEQARTGCTVVIPPEGSRGGVCIQGGGPGTRETDTLGPLANAAHATALLFAGGSAFGLAAADGVVRWCEQRGRGSETPAGLVPIVPAAVIYDLASGSATVRPGPEEGYAACQAAGEGIPERGAVGAGTGAMVGKLMGRERGSRAGVGYAGLDVGGWARVVVLVVVNAVGDVIAEDGAVLAGIVAEGEEDAPRSAEAIAGLTEMPPLVPKRNSTLACVCTDAALDKRECAIVARMAVAGMARAVDPVFTPFDGDVAFCLASGPLEPGSRPSEPRGFPVAQVGVAAATATAAAIRDAVR
ncbi:MAG: P1 family peptidase [Solirubrobacterales bacterium]